MKKILRTNSSKAHIWDKSEKIDELMGQIDERKRTWLENVGETKPLFTEKEVEKAIYYIPRWPLLIHLAAAIFQMFASAFFHQFQCISAEGMFTLFKVDLLGISIMITGSAVSPIYYSFMCEDSFFWCKLWLT